MINTVSSDSRLSDCGCQQVGPNNIPSNEVAWTSLNLEKLIRIDQGSLIAEFFNTGQVASLANRRDHQISLGLVGSEMCIRDSWWSQRLVREAICRVLKNWAMSDP